MLGGTIGEYLRARRGGIAVVFVGAELERDSLGLTREGDDLDRHRLRLVDTRSEQARAYNLFLVRRESSINDERHVVFGYINVTIRGRQQLGICRLQINHSMKTIQFYSHRNPQEGHRKCRGQEKRSVASC